MPIHAWLREADSTLGNRLAWRAAAALCATFALIAVLVHQGVIRWTNEELPTTPKSYFANTLPPEKTTVSPEERSKRESVTDVQRRIDFCARHVTADRSFVVFSNGTCVIVNEPSEDPIETARETLNKCGGQEARFITRKIEAESYMVTYSEPVFHCLFPDEVAQLGPVVEADFQNFLAPAERLVQPAAWEPPFDAKIGLLARTFLAADTEDGEVAKVIRAMPVPGISPAAQASNDEDLRRRGEPLQGKFSDSTVAPALNTPYPTRNSQHPSGAQDPMEIGYSLLDVGYWNPGKCSPPPSNSSLSSTPSASKAGTVTASRAAK